MPHAPLLLEGIGAELPVTSPLLRAMAAVDTSGADAVVVVSPHGSTPGVHAVVEGSLTGFGIEGFEVAAATDERIARALSESWGRPLLEGPADHGLCVPLLLGIGGNTPVIGVTLAEVTGSLAHSLEEVMREAGDLTAALSDVGATCNLAVVASGHSSAGLAPRAPLTEVEGASRLHAELLQAFAGDPADATDVLLELGRAEGACGVGPLSIVADLCRGWSCVTLESDAPFGVGYVVGEWAA